MKRILFLISYILMLKIGYSQSAFKHKSQFEKVWVGDSLEYLKFDSTHAFFQFSGKYGYQNKKGYHILGDTLRLQDWYQAFSDKNNTLQHKDYDFLYTGKKKHLILKALNENALSLAGNRSKIEFKIINEIYLKRFDFDSLKFTSSICFGTCPEMSLTIKSNREVMFTGGRYAIKQGVYRASLSTILYNQLKDHLRKSAVNKIINWGKEIDDAPYYMITVFSNKKETLIKGYDLPLVAKDLLSFLLGLPKKIESDLK